MNKQTRLRQYVITFAVLPFILSSCAENYDKYSSNVRFRDVGVATQVSAAETSRYNAWVNAMKELANSTNPNAAMGMMALAMSKPAPVQVPTQAIAAPASGPDYIRAFTPAAGILAGAWLGGKVIDGLAAATGTVTNINAEGDVTNSGNVKKQTISQKDIGGNATVEGCLDCEKEKPDPDERIDSRGNEKCTDDAIFGNGVWWVDKVNGCSCKSREEGRC